MTRFDADDPAGRRTLIAAAIAAHRERGSAFCTFEPGAVPPGADDDLRPWIQFGGTTVAMDCTDAELDRLKTLVGEYPDVRIDDLERPAAAEGTHAQLTSRSDVDRLAGFVDGAFREVFGYPEDYRLWIVAI